jgi:ABC-type transporter Mla subunit MlaD
MASHSELQTLISQLVPKLGAELEATQDEVKRLSNRLRSVLPGFLQGDSKTALDDAIDSLGQADKQLTVCLQRLYEQYQTSRVEG